MGGELGRRMWREDRSCLDYRGETMVTCNSVKPLPSGRTTIEADDPGGTARIKL